MAAGTSSILSLGQLKYIFSRDALNKFKKIQRGAFGLEHSALLNTKKFIWNGNNIILLFLINHILAHVAYSNCSEYQNNIILVLCKSFFIESIRVESSTKQKFLYILWHY